MGGVLPKALRGPAAAIALGSLNKFDLSRGRSIYESLYHEEANSLLTGTAQEMFDAIDFLKQANPEQYQPAKGVNYAPANNNNNNGGVGRALLQIAQLIKANIGLQVAFVDVRGGWDTHQSEAFRLPPLLQRLGQALAAFHQDLGDRMEDVVVLTMSEFGRTARENGNRGTDHGHANVMFVMGGAVKGGKVYGKWPGLEKEQLNEDRDLALTTDFRDVFAEMLVQHLGCENPEVVFPAYPLDPKRFKKLV